MTAIATEPSTTRCADCKHWGAPGETAAMLRTCMTPKFSEDQRAIILDSPFWSRVPILFALPHGLKVTRTLVHRDSGIACPGFEPRGGE